MSFAADGNAIASFLPSSAPLRPYFLESYCMLQASLTRSRRTQWPMYKVVRVGHGGGGANVQHSKMSGAPKHTPLACDRVLHHLVTTRWMGETYLWEEQATQGVKVSWPPQLEQELLCCLDLGVGFTESLSLLLAAILKLVSQLLHKCNVACYVSEGKLLHRYSRSCAGHCAKLKIQANAQVELQGDIP